MTTVRRMNLRVAWTVLNRFSQVMAREKWPNIESRHLVAAGTTVEVLQRACQAYSDQTSATILANLTASVSEGRIDASLIEEQIFAQRVDLEAWQSWAKALDQELDTYHLPQDISPEQLIRTLMSMHNGGGPIFDGGFRALVRGKYKGKPAWAESSSVARRDKRAELDLTYAILSGNGKNARGISPDGLISFVTSPEGRPTNEDGVLVIRSRDGRRILLMVADGMGGYGLGELASFMVMVAVAVYTMADKTAEEAVVLAHQLMRQNSKLQKACAATCLLMVEVYDNQAKALHWGDIRLYRYASKSGLELLTQDHSNANEYACKVAAEQEQPFVWPLSDDRLKQYLYLTEAARRSEEIKSGVLGGIGATLSTVMPEQVAPVFLTLKKGDSIFGLTDGGHDYLDPTEITLIMEGHMPSALALIEFVHQNPVPERDNASGFMLRIG